MLKRIGFFVLLLFVPAVLTAQSPKSATGGEGFLDAGGEASAFNPDFSCNNDSPFHCALLGPAVFFDFNPTAKWGVEGEARWLHWHGVGGEKESNYLAGPRYRVWRFHRLNAWAKFELGGGWITTPYYPAAGTLQGSYFVLAPGGTLTYPLTHRISVRGDYEFQFWPSFAGPPTFNTSGALVQQNGLNPNGFSLGLSYRILGR